MSETDTLAGEVRAVPTVVEAVPIDVIRRHARDRWNRKRLTAGSIGAVAVLVVTAGAVLAVTRQHRIGDGPIIEAVGSTADPGPSSSTSRVATSSLPATGSTGSTGNDTSGRTFDPNTTLAPTDTPTTLAPTTTSPPPPAPVGLDPHGLSTDGPRPLRFGASVTEAEAVTGKAAVGSGGEMCGPLPVSIKDALPGVDLVFTDGRTLHFLDVRGPGLTTISGIGVGTPISTLIAKVPTVETIAVGDQTVYVVHSAGNASTINFYAADGVTISSMLAGSGDLAHVQDIC